MSFLTTAARTWLTRTRAPFHFTNKNEERLNYADSPGLGLYVHIPFCRSICNFCPYCKEIYRADAAEAYTEALLQEIDMVAAGNAARTTVGSLYFGGGTPALLAPQMARIINKLQQYFEITDGIGAELHPADVNVPTLTKLKEAGVTRISIGIQSFLPQFAKALGRPAPNPQKLKEALAQVPFETVSMDFIFALPGQQREDVWQDIELAFANGANHVAVYPFIDFSFTGSPVHAMEKKAKHRLLDEITDYCNRHGYVRDSIWTFALPGGHRYSSMTRDTFIGFGCSATTLLRDSFKINTFSVKEYIDRIQSGKLPTALTCRYTRRQRMVYYLFWRAYSTFVDSADFKDFFGTDLEKEFRLELWLARMLGYITKEPKGYRLTPKGAFYFHYYENFYTLAYIDKMWGILRNTPFPEEIRL